MEYENDNTHADMLNIPVDHVVIDFHSTFLTHKIQWVQNELEKDIVSHNNQFGDRNRNIKYAISDFNLHSYVPYTTQEIIYMINNRYGKDMDK